MTMYGRIEDGKLVLGLPMGGQLMDGRSVSNYYLMDRETLLDENWLPCMVELPVTFNPYTQTLVLDIYTIKEDIIIVKLVASN